MNLMPAHQHCDDKCDEPKNAPFLETGGFYYRDEIATAIDEDCSALSDARLAEYATKKLGVRVIYLEGFLGLVFLVRKKELRRRLNVSLLSGTF